MLALIESGENVSGIPDIKEIPRLRELLLAIVAGSTMRDACKSIGLSPFMFWKYRKQNPDLDDAYEAATVMAREEVAQECLRIAKATTYETVSADRLLVETLKWQAARVLGGHTSGGRPVSVNVDARHVTVGSVIAEVTERRRAIAEGREVEHTETAKNDKEAS